MYTFYLFWHAQPNLVLVFPTHHMFIHDDEDAIITYFKGSKSQKFWQLLPSRQTEEEKATSDKKTTKLNVSREARDKIIAADCQWGHLS